MRTLSKKVVSILLLVCLLILSGVVNAKNDNEKLSKKEIDKLKSTIQDIASGKSDTVVGDGVPFDFPVPEGSVQPDWYSHGINHTHQFLAARGILILENDKSWNVAQHLYEGNGTNLILEGADAPDDSETDGYTFSGHFFNPYTGTNFLNLPIPTAMVRFDEHYENAVNNFNSNKTYAWQELGRAIHYLSDANESHHAANLVAIITNHTTYEEWVDMYRFNYGISNSDNATYNSVLGSTNYDIVYNCALNAYGYVPYATSNYSSDFGYAAAPTLAKAQKTIAAVLWKFLFEVGEI